VPSALLKKRKKKKERKLRKKFQKPGPPRHGRLHH